MSRRRSNRSGRVAGAGVHGPFPSLCDALEQRKKARKHGVRILQLSSGDLVADRRAAYAEAYAEQKEFAAAADVMGQALELVPGWAAGWSLLGDYREKAGDIDGAIAAWRHLAGLDPDGMFGAALKLSAHGEGAFVVATAYAESLFDDYAGRFETSLLERLGYTTPRELWAAIVAVSNGRQVDLALDLGCGTGLMGLEIRASSRTLVGVDISSGMLAQAARKGIYDELIQGEIGAVLARCARRPDLVTASDVLNYTGPLPPVLAAVRRIMPQGGLFAFSLETHDGTEPLLLRRTLRYAHAEAAALADCVAAGFTVLTARRSVLRYDAGEPVAGCLIVAEAR